MFEMRKIKITTKMKNRNSILALLLFFIPIAYFFLDKSISILMTKLPSEILEIFSFITTFGSPVLIIACIVMLIRYSIQTKIRGKDRLSQRLYLFIPATVIPAWGISHLLKFIFGRMRPSLLFSDSLYGFTFFNNSHDMTSFPSGHTILITSFMLSLLIFKPKLKWLLACLIFIISISRIILNKHFLSDVIFGFIIGLLAVEVSRYVFAKNGINLMLKRKIEGNNV